MIDPTARIEDGAVLGEGTSIGPYCVIGPDVVIGANCKLIAHVHITAQTTIGDNCTIYPFVSLGTPPQSLGYRGELTRLQIGHDCTLREHTTMNAGTVTGGGITRVGDRGYFMNCSHVGHDCTVGNDVVFATSATLGRGERDYRLLALHVAMRQRPDQLALLLRLGDRLLRRAIALDGERAG